MALPKFTSATGALIIVIAFLVFTFYVANQAETDSPEVWNRLYAIFSSIEALGFAAAGLILGRTIDIPSRQEMRDLHRVNAELHVRASDAQRGVQETRKEIEVAKKLLSNTDDPTATRPEAELALDRALMRSAGLQFTSEDSLHTKEL